MGFFGQPLQAGMSSASTGPGAGHRLGAEHPAFTRNHRMLGYQRLREWNGQPLRRHVKRAGSSSFGFSNNSSNSTQRSGRNRLIGLRLQQGSSQLPAPAAWAPHQQAPTARAPAAPAAARPSAARPDCGRRDSGQERFADPVSQAEEVLGLGVCLRPAGRDADESGGGIANGGNVNGAGANGNAAGMGINGSNGSSGIKWFEQRFRVWQFRLRRQLGVRLRELWLQPQLGPGGSSTPNAPSSPPQ